MSYGYDDYVDRVRQLLFDSCESPSFSISMGSAGVLPAGTLNVRVSSITEFGETIPGSRVTSVVPGTADGKATITIVRVPQATAYKIYASMDADVETLQAIVTIGQGISVTHVISSLVSGSAMPVSNTGTQHIAIGSIQGCLNQSVFEYSQNFPLIRKQIIATTSGLQTYALPVDFITGFSIIKSLEYPAASDYSASVTYGAGAYVYSGGKTYISLQAANIGNDPISSPTWWQASSLIPSQYIDREDWYIYEDAEVVFSNTAFTSVEAVRMRYTTTHVLSVSEITIPAMHAEGICLLAASFACEQLAVRYSHLGDGYIGAEVVNWKTRASQMMNSAKEYRKLAYNNFGGSGGSIPASASAHI